MLPHDGRAPFEQNPWKLFRNNSSETIPPFSLLRIEGAENTDQPEHAIRFIAGKPNDDFKTHYMVSGPMAVPEGKDGFCTTLAQADYVAYDDGDGTPNIADIEWGAKQDQWTLAKYRPGFHIEGGTKLTAGVNAVVARQRVVTDLIGKCSSGIVKGSTGTGDIWMGASGAEAATEYTLADVSALGAAITADKWVVFFLRHGVWYVGPWEC
jgi:hypothetical protein